MHADDGLGGGITDGLLRFGAFLAASAILALGLLARGGNTDVRWLAALALSAPFFVILFWPRLPYDLPTFNRTVVRLGTLLVVAFLLTSIHLVRLQVVRADELRRQAGEAPNGDVVANPRLLDETLRRQRGKIFDRNGKLLADTEASPQGFAIRRYPSPAGSYVVGYYSPALYGLAGLEREYDDYLDGAAGDNPLLILQRDLLHRSVVGNDLHLTLDLRLQEIADRALGDRQGAVVALDPKTGAVLTMVSKPHFDPQQLVLDPTKEDKAELARAKAYWASITSEGAGNPLLPRVTQGLYVPGSIFKTVTAATALDAGIANPAKIYPDPGEIVIDGHRIVELNRPQPVKNEYTLQEGYKYSLNIVFAQVGLDIGTVRMRDYTSRFGFGEEIPFDLPVVPSRLSNDPNYLSNKPALADTAFGQGELQVTPLQMALITATVANGGKMPEPYLLASVRSPQGETLKQTRPQVWRDPIKSSTAEQVRQLMIATVESGGAQNAKIAGLTVGGKTGTAEIGDGSDDSHAWYIGFAGRPNQPPEIVIAVIVERGGSGGTVALPIANEVIQAYFAQR